ncbi:MAG TPA: hypothetical protein VE820_08565 [Sphingomicrobium sp.]|nr:hypothetical protein [Sphingomicrobium sp.]
MPLFFFHLRDGTDTLIDEEGADLSGADEARAAAVTQARSIISHDALKGVIDLKQRIDVVDQAGTPICSIEFGDAVQVISNDRRD